MRLAATDLVAGIVKVDPLSQLGGKVTRYDRAATGDDTFIGWNGRSLAETVVVVDSADDADPTASETFAYGPDGRRYHRKSVWKDGGVSRTDHTFYAGAVEERLLDGHADYASVRRTRVAAGIVEVRTLSHPDPANNNRQTAVSSLEYLHRDHLGSIEAVTDASGAELLTLAHDPFGARRKADWTRSLNASRAIIPAAEESARSTRLRPKYPRR